MDSKDKNPRKRSVRNNKDDTVKEPEKDQDLRNPDFSEEISELETQVNEKLPISYFSDEINLDRSKVTVDNVFAYNVVLNLIQDSEDHEPKFVEECRRRDDWSKWKEAIQSELNSLSKRKVFGSIVQTPNGVKPVGYK